MTDPNSRVIQTRLAKCEPGEIDGREASSHLSGLRSAPMAAGNDKERLTGVVDHLVFVNEENGWTVLRLLVKGQAEPATVVGNLAQIQEGESLELAGSWVEDRKFGRQFKVESFRPVLPTDVRAIEKYLGSGLIRGIGKAMARRLVERFGDQTLEVIDRFSGRLTEVPGIGAKRSAEIRRAWTEQREIREVMLFLQAHDVGTANALKIWKTYGSESLAVLRANPYRLARDIHGIGFKTADSVATRLGLPPTAPERLAAAFAYLLNQASEQGHLLLPRPDLLQQASELLAVEAESLAPTLDSLVARRELRTETQLPFEAGPPVYLPALYAAETHLAAGLGALARQGPPQVAGDLERALAWFESKQEITLAPAQREAIARAFATRVLVITGGPGTGKTTLVRGIVAISLQRSRRVLLAAPTGRAAKRLSEATGQEARTVHRLLEWSPRTLGFERNAERPLEVDLLLVDESSMLDAPLAGAIVDALPAGAQLALVGDIDQLPSVGPGNVLADLIASEVAEVVRLTQVFRQARESRIVVNAHRVRDGLMPELTASDRSDFFFIERNEPEAVRETIGKLVTERVPQRFGFDPMADIQVLSPMNRGPLGVAELNAFLRERLNPRGQELVRGGKLLRVGDKVMQVRNNYEREVFNGDLGRILALDSEEQELEVDFDGRRLLYPWADLDELVPAYACSIHKSQGSEYPCVVLPIHGQHYVMLERNLLYTAITRASKLAVLVGEKRALGIAVGNTRNRRRNSLLRERLQAAISASS
jgi:exodeoxyribonuclease V alpha subunit